MVCAPNMALSSKWTICCNEYGVCTKHGIVYQLHHVDCRLSNAMCYGDGGYGVCTKHGIVYPTPIRGHVPAPSPAAITKHGFRRKLSK